MKRFVIVMILLALVIGMSGCMQKNEDFVNPVSFYYCNDISSKDDFEHVFVPELREGAGYWDNKPALLSLYLTGPENEDLVTPFPAGLSIISVQHDNGQVRVVLSDQFADLTGLDLSIACTCLGMTVLELYGCDCVEISAEHKPLGEQKSIIITADMVVLADNDYTIGID